MYLSTSIKNNDLPNKDHKLVITCQSFSFPLAVMFKEEDPLLSPPSVQPLDRGTVCPLGGRCSVDRSFHMRSDPMNEDRGLGFHLPASPVRLSPPDLFIVESFETVS